MALIDGRDFVTPDDVKDFTVDALAHRIIFRIEENLEGASPRNIIEDIVKRSPFPSILIRAETMLTKYSMKFIAMFIFCLLLGLFWATGLLLP